MFGKNNTVLSGHCGTFIFKNESECKEDYHGRDSYLFISYQKINRCSNVTIDNIRRNISSFFSWLEEEDYILKSPMKRIHKIKTKTVVKSVITDEGIEKLRDNCAEIRDLAIIDLLYSTGIRVGELVNLNIETLI